MWSNVFYSPLVLLNDSFQLRSSQYVLCVPLVLKRTTSNCCNIIILTLEGQRFKVKMYRF